MTTPRATTMQKSKPVEPDWFKKLVLMGQVAASCKPVGNQAVLDFKNYCRQLVRSGSLRSWTVDGGTVTYKVTWVARDKQWSRSI